MNPALFPVEKSRGFSLLEILVAVALLMLISSLLFAVLNASSHLWRESEKRIEGFREARAALNFMNREIRSLSVLDSSVSDSFFINPSSSEITMPSNLRGDRIFFVASLGPGMQRAEDQSDLCVIGYFLAWNGEAYNLHRHFRGSNSFYGLLSDGGPIFQNVAIADDSFNEVIARNITNMVIRSYRRVGDELESIMPWPGNERPTAIEIELTAINAETAIKFGGDRSRWEDSSDMKTQASYTFTLRIPLFATPSPSAAIP